MKQPFVVTVVDLMAMLETNGMRVTEIEVTDVARDRLARECGLSSHPSALPPGVVGTFNGARIITRPKPLTPGQRAAAALRKLADDLEKQQ